MYDLVEDPDEMNNVFADPRYAPVRQELEALLARRPDDMLAQPLEQIGMA